jgi:hypothetical protein
MVATLGCTNASKDVDSRDGSIAPASNALYWRLVIKRADGSVESVPSADRPIICGREEEPEVLLFCGTGVGMQNNAPAPAWDFLRVSTGAGDTYKIEPPAGLTPAPTTPTPTVVRP